MNVLLLPIFAHLLAVVSALPPLSRNGLFTLFIPFKKEKLTITGNVVGVASTTMFQEHVE